jgi:hypothetical protein
MKSLTNVAIKAVALALLAGSALAADLEDRLERTYKGAWLLTRTEVFSDCGLFYTDTEVNGSRVISKGDRRFAPGELARVEKLNLKSDRVDLYLIVDEKVLEPREDGPFTLYDERTCKVQLMVDVPRDMVSAGNEAPVDALLQGVVEPFDTHDAARRSNHWNQRLREALPADYEETLLRHAAWQVEQENAKVAAARDDALEEAARAADRIKDDPSYLAGLAAGVEAQRSFSAPGCSFLASTTFFSVKHRAPAPPRGVADGRAFERGFEDGQALRYHLELARALRGCFQAPPPAPR